MGRKKKNKFPSKKEIIDTLLKEDPKPVKFKKLMLIIEHKKINNKLGLAKAELLQDEKVILKGSMTCIPKKAEDSFNWGIITAGESYFEGYSLDYQEETIGSMIKQGIKKALKSGKIPFIQK